MRTAILFLVFVNVAFFYWAKQQDFGQVVTGRSSLALGQTPIELLSERSINGKAKSIQRDAAYRLSSRAGQPGNSKPKLVCFSVGPFANSGLSDDVYKVLLDSGIDARQRSVKERQPKSYWVYLPPHKSLDAAKATVAYLENNNVRDYYIMPEPPNHLHAISLGLYEKLGAARSKVAEIKKLQLKPEMEVRFNEFTQHWVDFRQDGDSEQPNVLEELLRKNDRMLVLESKCT